MRTANLKEWIGKTDDSRPPPHVRLRIFEKHNGICYLSKVKIQPGDKWEAEHILAICNGGSNRESNMAPALVAPHKTKTKQDRATKAKNDHVRMKHLGIRPANYRPMPGSKASGIRKRMDGRVERRT
jgi:5-methylcytosine-specific restriction endonuclease McrA